MHVATGATLYGMTFDFSDYIAEAIKDSKRSTIE
jgi:hypothetical protein